MSDPGQSEQVATAVQVDAAQKQTQDAAAQAAQEAQKAQAEAQKAQAAQAAQEQEQQRQAQAVAEQAQKQAVQAAQETASRERIPLAQLGKSQLDETSKFFLSEYLKPTSAVRSREQRDMPGKSLLRLPFFGALAPGEFRLANLMGPNTGPVITGIPTIPEHLYAILSLQTPLQAAFNVTSGIVGATLPTATIAALIGGSARAVIDGMRWAIFKEKTADVFAREVLWRGTDKGKKIDVDATFNILFSSDKNDINQLLGLRKEIDEGGSAKELSERIGKDMTKILIRKATGANLDALALDRILPAEKHALLKQTEREQLQGVKSAYETAQMFFNEGLDASEKIEFAENDLKPYLERREFTNHIKAIGVRSGVAGFRASVVGVAASLFRGVIKTGLLGDLVGRTGRFVADIPGQIPVWAGQFKDTITTAIGAFNQQSAHA